MKLNRWGLCMKTAEILRETPTLKKLSECTLAHKDDSFIFHQHLFNIKRLILEIKYENIEKTQLTKFLHDLDQFVLDKLGKNKNCKEIIKDWYHNFNTLDPFKPGEKEVPNPFSAFFQRAVDMLVKEE